jgi:hypothetical protein
MRIHNVLLHREWVFGKMIDLEDAAAPAGTQSCRATYAREKRCGGGERDGIGTE